MIRIKIGPLEFEADFFGLALAAYMVLVLAIAIGITLTEIFAP